MSDELNSLDPSVQGIVAEARRLVRADPAARRRLLEAIRAEPLPHRRTRVVHWMLSPRGFTLPPLAAAALAAGLVGIGIFAGLSVHRDGRSATEQPVADAPSAALPDSLKARTIKFVLIAPQADRVSVVGDFNGWDASANPMRAERGGSGIWTAFVPLEPGVHNYSFVVDGAHFVADPTAPIAPDDGYGHKSSVVLVGGSSS